MTSRTRNRLLLLGALWGLALAALPAFVMANPFRPTGFLLAALVSAALGGAAGAAVAGKRALGMASAGDGGRFRIVSGVKAGMVQGLVGGAVAALLVWTLMAVTISGFSLGGPLEPSVLTSLRVFLGSFFVALSVFLYALVGGLVLGPLFWPLVERAARGKVRGKEEPVVR